MLTLKQKKFLDGVCRESLIYCVENSRHGNNVGLKNWIKEEASYADVVVASMTGRVLMEEGEAEREAELQAQETLFKRILQYPLSIIAGGAMMKGGSQLALKAAGSMAGPMTTGLISNIGTVLGMGVGGAAMGWGITLLAKLIFYIIRQKFDFCIKACKKKFDIRETFYDQQVPLCASQCRAMATQQMLTRLQSERGKCAQTKEPEKCERNILNQIIKYKNILAKEMIRINKRKIALQKAQEGFKKKKSLTAEPPQMKNVLKTT